MAKQTAAVHSIPFTAVYIRIPGILIVSKYVAESITIIAGRFGHEGLCQLRTEQIQDQIVISCTNLKGNTIYIGQLQAGNGDRVT